MFRSDPKHYHFFRVAMINYNACSRSSLVSSSRMAASYSCLARYLTFPSHTACTQQLTPRDIEYRVVQPSPKKNKPYHGNTSPSHCKNFPPSFSVVALSTTCKYPWTHSSTLMARKKSSPEPGSAACSINELDISVTTSPG